jgi:LCP family protein required for cell wall assembly
MDARRALRVGVRTLVALTSVLALAVAGLAWSLQQQLDTAVTSSAAIPDAAPTPPGQAYNALLVGLDARTDSAGNPLPPELFNALHVGPDAGQLDTDTIILLHVPADPDQPAEAISIPRDSYVPIAGGRGMHKINSAYEAGLKSAEDTLTAQGVTGPELDRRGREAGRATLVATVEQLTGVQIDHFAEINFVGFVQLTEALGGVPVCLRKPVHDSYSGVDLPAGPQTVNGATAAPRPGGRRPRPHRPPAGLRRGFGGPADLDGHAHQPDPARPTGRRGEQERRARRRVERRAGPHAVRRPAGQ